ncbi:CocE/NonD family hydrolase [Streptomyces botrytidirepellens]|uniref:CocE/NonD family hydrolase n=1 Tax=Streptomyces botrytidirepellens TaxID=2486417 RepID=A0A3M8WX90_9ACTN|nr:CocE/NonD family hydrolase [Streptomyces botrytidirepellens]RNG34802.1 CocE/NonD family hydrolase [Streptomyces botrytidirepellens]
MNLSSHVVQRMLRLPPPRTRDLTVVRDLRVPMRDGAVLLADRWAPETGGDGLPTALIRLPYGRSGMTAAPMVRPLAERGFQVLIQSTRGTFGSDGPFDPLRCEREDGLDTLDWIIEQPWFGESMILCGASYSGFTQWAVADAVPPQVKAMIPGVSESALTLDFLHSDAFSLETPFVWGVQVAGQERRLGMVRAMLGGKKVQRALRTLPLNQADSAAIGHRDDYLQNILVHDADAPFWQNLDHRDRVADITAPVSSVGGWYDIFLPGQLRDHRALQDAGHSAARLTVGPWTHISMDVGHTYTAEALDFGLALARGEKPAERAPVRLFVMGEEKWRDFPSWPPPGYEPQRFHLQPDGALAPEEPGASPPDGYRYDPADPTPAVGGVRMAFGEKAGRVDNTALEARPDVLTYTTPVLNSDVEVIGEVSAEIFFRSSLPFADVFVRLCGVDADGRSTNVCDGLISLTGADETRAAQVRLWPTAYRFQRGHRIRVQVSSGAFPRYNRNPGTGEPRATATILRPADQQVFHDPDHPSAVVLPIRRG